MWYVIYYEIPYITGNIVAFRLPGVWNWCGKSGNSSNHQYQTTEQLCQSSSFHISLPSSVLGYNLFSYCQEMPRITYNQRFFVPDINWMGMLSYLEQISEARLLASPQRGCREAGIALCPKRSPIIMVCFGLHQDHSCRQ